MRRHRLPPALAALTFVAAIACADSSPLDTGITSVAAHVSIKKNYPRKIYVHVMPWFQVGGPHWSMNSRNSATGVASWYAPMIGEYNSGDPVVIEYQLLMMKYAGIDGVMIDWPGLNGANDLPQNKNNAEAMINRTAAFGMEFGIVYEDQYAVSVDAARNDMSYVRDNFFSKPNHMKVNGAPAILVFGPQKFLNPAEWTNILSVFPQNPMFFALWYNNAAGSNADGKFAWLAPNGLKGVADFDNARDGVNHGLTIPVLYPGFNPYYAQGGWPGPNYKISYTLTVDNTEGGDTFRSTFELGKYAGDPLQIATWNDYGEGTMIEPTNQFQYRFLTTLQQSVGTAYTDAELKIVKMLYDQRRQGGGGRQAMLDQASAALANLDLAAACAILGCTVPVHDGTGGASGTGGSTGAGGSPGTGGRGTGGATGSGGSPAGTGGRGGAPGTGGTSMGTGGATATGGSGMAGQGGAGGAAPPRAGGSSGCSVAAAASQDSHALLLAAGALALVSIGRRPCGRRRGRPNRSRPDGAGLLAGLFVWTVGACSGMGTGAPPDAGAGNNGGAGSGGQSGTGGRTTGTGGNATGGASGSGGAAPDASGLAGSGGGGGAAGAPGSGIGTTEPMGQPTLPSGRGAIMPFTEYEAETGTVMGGTILGPTRNVNNINDIAAEASGRRAVRLAATNAYVEFKNLAPSNSIVVRYSIPDGGLDSWSTLSLYVDGKFRQKLKVTSRYSWSYGGADDFANTGIQNNPGAGNPHHFFDDTRALVGDIPVNALVRLQKDADDAAAHYDIDLIDMEQVPAALTKPDGFVSVTECGAMPNDGVDDSAAVQRCVTSSRNVYFPEGTFDFKSKEISLPGTTIRGAGMWRSVISGFFARFDCYAQGCKFYDFAISGDNTQRDDRSPDTAFTGNRMSGAVIEHIWVEHKKLGVWPGPNTAGLVVRNSRFRNLYADGINLPCGATNAIIEHVHVRNSGDDAFAVWSQPACAPNSNNVFRHVFAQLPWRANCFGLYGGSTTVQDSVCADTVQYPGVLLGRMFDAHAFSMTKITGVTFTRAGGPMYGQQGAIKLNSEQGPVQNIQISNVDVDASTYSGIHLAGGNTIDTVSIANVNIRNPGGCGLLAQTTGAADTSNVVVSGTGSGLCNEKGFNFIKGAGNSGW